VPPCSWPGSIRGPTYQHDNQFPFLQRLDQQDSGSPHRRAQGQLSPASFKDVGGVLTANFSDEHFALPNAYFLAIQTEKIDGSNLAGFVQDGDKFKLMPLSLAKRAIRGIELKEERVAPMGLPARVGLHYFRLERRHSARMWQTIQPKRRRLSSGSAAISTGPAPVSPLYDRARRHFKMIPLDARHLPMTLLQLTEPLFQYMCGSIAWRAAARRPKPAVTNFFCRAVPRSRSNRRSARARSGRESRLHLARSEIKAIFEDMMAKAATDVRLSQQARKVELLSSSLWTR